MAGCVVGRCSLWACWCETPPGAQTSTDAGSPAHAFTPTFRALHTVSASYPSQALPRGCPAPGRGFLPFHSPLPISSHALCSFASSCGSRPTVACTPHTSYANETSIRPSAYDRIFVLLNPIPYPLRNLRPAWWPHGASCRRACSRPAGGRARHRSVRT